MTTAGVFVVGTLLTWFGYAFALRASYLGFSVIARRGNEVRSATITAILAALALLIGSRFAGGSLLNFPLVWPIMPFAAWAFIVSVALMVVRASQASSGLNREEHRAHLKAAAIWALAAIGFVFWYRLDPDASMSVVKGSIPMAASTLMGLVLLALATIAVMVFTARAARARNIARGVATHLALIAGSILFGLPLVWLVVTSFKEDIDMASPNGIVWVPRVQQTAPYYSKTSPLYAATVNGTRVEGEIMDRRPDGHVKLDINKPLSMRGTTLEATLSELREVPRNAPLVTFSANGDKKSGLVIESLDDGRQRIDTGAGVFVAKPEDITPVRKIGLRTQNYPDALDFLPAEANKGLTYLKNTLILVVLGLIGTILSSAIVAYAFSRMRFPGRDVMFWLMLATMMLPGAVTKLPQFMIFKQLGWIDTLYPLWVPAFFGSAFNIFMLRQFFKQIPMELEDAAKIDGAGYLRTFWSVMMPQIQPAIAVIAILTFVGTWNNFFDPLIYLNSPENMTISYAVQLYANDRSSEPGLVTAFTTLAMLPVLGLFFLAQRYFIEGVTLSGMGGR